jgi:hypothetical protein
MIDQNWQSSGASRKRAIGSTRESFRSQSAPTGVAVGRDGSPEPPGSERELEVSNGDTFRQKALG